MINITNRLGNANKNHDEISFHTYQNVGIQSLSCISMIPWTAAHQALLSITNSQSLFKLMFTESEMPYNHAIL